MAKVSKKQYEIQKNWVDKLSRAKKVRKAWKDLFKVDLAREYLDGKQNPGNPAEEWITINNVYSYLKAQLPALYSADPYFYVNLKRSFSPNPMDIALWEQKGKIRGAYLNYLKDELELKKKARLAIQDAMFAYGVMKVHHSSDMHDNPDAGKAFMSEDGETVLSDTDGMPLIQPDQVPINARYNLNRIHPDDFLWDEDAGPLEGDWGWVAQRIRQPLEELKKDPRFSKRALKFLEGKSEEKGDEEKTREDRQKGGEIQGKAERARPKKKKSKEPEIIARWEIYNLKSNSWTIIAEEGEIPLMDTSPLPPGIEKDAYCILRFTLRDDSPYPIPPFSQGIDPSKEYNRARSDIQTHRKRFNRKYEVWTQAFEDADTEIGKLESGGDGSILRKRQPEQSVLPIQDAQTDPMRYHELAYLNAEMNDLFGHDTGETAQIAKADSATQAGILDKRLEVKEGDAISLVIDWIKDIARKLDQLVQAHITQDEAVKISGPQGEMWEMVRANDYQEIEGEYEYSVNVGATLPRMPAIERSSWMAFLSLLAQFPHLLLSKRLFKKMAELHHIEDEILIEEMHKIGQQIMQGQLPMPGGGGSQPGVGEDRPQSAMGGMAGGIQSLSKGNAAIGV